MSTAKNGFQILNLHPKKHAFQKKVPAFFNAYRVKKIPNLIPIKQSRL